jgi:hypothetical protein
MKKYITCAVFSALALLSAKCADWKNWNVQSVYSVAVSDLKFSNAKQGGGLGFELFPIKNLGVQVQGVTYDTHHSVLDEGSAALNYYVPVSKDSKISLFASLGTLKGFEVNENWQYKVGGGIAAMITDKISSRVGGYLVDDFKHKTEMRFEAAVGFGF